MTQPPRNRTVWQEPPEVNNTPDLHGVYEKLGEITATLRDVSHTSRNNSAKIDALGEMVIRQGLIHDKVEGHSALLERHHDRIIILEVDKHHREGAIGLFEWVSKHWPFTALGAAILAAIAWANGKLGF